MPDVARKLLLRPGATVRLVNAPEGVDDVLGPLPEGTRRSTSGPDDVVVNFVRDPAEFQASIEALRQDARSSRVVWVAYPKKRSGRAGG